MLPWGRQVRGAISSCTFFISLNPTGLGGDPQRDDAERAHDTVLPTFTYTAPDPFRGVGGIPVLRRIDFCPLLQGRANDRSHLIAEGADVLGRHHDDIHGDRYAEEAPIDLLGEATAMRSRGARLSLTCSLDGR